VASQVSPGRFRPRGTLWVSPHDEGFALRTRFDVGGTCVARGTCLDGTQIGGSGDCGGCGGDQQTPCIFGAPECTSPRNERTGSTSITYTQDLVAPLSQILSDGSITYIYGNGAERLLGLAGTTQTWYLGDALGSVRQTQNSVGDIQQFVTYDPWGVPQNAAISPFGFTSELQQGENVYLQA
jgi:hypothetical protein